MHDGGIRVPGIIRWPGHVPAGQVASTSVLAGVDWLPTMAAISGQEIPDIAPEQRLEQGNCQKLLDAIDDNF